MIILRRLARVVVLTAVLAAVPPTAAASIQDQIADARSLAGRCAFQQAIISERAALGQAKREWPIGHEGFFIFHQDLASFANSSFDYAVAEENARAALEIARNKRGDQDPLYALAAQNLGVALAGQQRFVEAEPLQRAAVEIFTKRADVANTLTALLALSGLEFAQGRSEGGLRFAEQAALLLPRIPPSGAAAVPSAALRIADARRRMLRFTEADAAIAIADQTLSRGGRSGTKRLALGKASLSFERGRLQEAMNFVEAAERLPADPCDLMADADLAFRRATIHMIRREVAEARLAFGQAIARVEALGLQRNPRYAEGIAGLAMTSGLAGEFDKADQLFTKAAAAYRASFGRVSSAEVQTMLEHAYALSIGGQSQRAIEIARAAMALLDGPMDQQPLDKSYAAASLGRALKEAGRFSDAEPYLAEALRGFSAVRGENSFDLAPGLLSLGEVKLAQRRYAEAEGYFRRALTVQEKGGWTGAQAIGVAHSRLAAVYKALGREDAALAESSRAVQILQDRMTLGEARPWADAEGERRRARDIIEQDLALMIDQVVRKGAAPKPMSIDRLLRSGQLGASVRTGEAIAQMAERLSLRGDALGTLVRERQDLIGQWRSLQEDQILALVGDGAANEAMAAAAAQRQRTISDRLRAIDTQIDQSDRRAAMLLKSPIASLAEVQAALRSDEGVLCFFVATDHTYVVALTKEGQAAYAVPLTRASLDQAVRTLRLALDPSEWNGDVPPLFPARIAYDLYLKLIAPARALLGGKAQLIVAPDGPLMSLPLGVLLTAPIDDQRQGPATYQKAPWLVRDFAIEVVPSLAAFTALRQLTARQYRDTTFLGIGAPNFNGPPGGAARRLLMTDSFDTRLARTNVLRNLPALPETSEELRTIATELGTDKATLLMGDQANEHSVRTMTLGSYKVIAFATHGLIAGVLKGYGEPALVLSPPAQPSSENDGLLSASEIAGLTIDADWVILSACSTAAGDGRPEAEPFTGLAKAFFYAGARALLVTNWPVETKAAASISTKTIANYRAGMTRAAALRAAQLSIIADESESGRTHPVFWASFNVVGAN